MGGGTGCCSNAGTGGVVTGGAIGRGCWCGSRAKAVSCAGILVVINCCKDPSGCSRRRRKLKEGRGSGGGGSGGISFIVVLVGVALNANFSFQ